MDVPAILDGVGKLDSLAEAVWPGLVLGTVRFGDPAIVDLGVIAFDLVLAGGLDFSADG